jgi:hypothetical protein
MSDDDEERVVQETARIAAQAELAASAGRLPASEYDDLLRDLFRARTMDDARDVAERRGIARPPHRVPELEVRAIRPELSCLDCRLGRTYPDEYAGYRFDDDWRYVAFGFRSNLWRHIASIRARSGFAHRVSGFNARFALVELQYCEVMLLRARERLRDEGIRLTWVTLATASNRVEVGVERLDATVAERLRGEFGEMIDVTERPAFTV